ncbi:MAG: M15 family metallopeptidase [Pseudomonadota bacterium]
MRLTPLLLLTCCVLCAELRAEVPDGFIDIERAVPGVVVEARYFSANNFMGEVIDGYHAPRIYLTSEAAQALARVQARLKDFGVRLKVFDAYRPQRAVDHFVRWTKDAEDTRMKMRYYPQVNKRDLIPEGYIAARSGHSRGSTLDLTLVSGAGVNAPELDMGTPFDFFGPEAHGVSDAVTPQQRANRLLLRTVMEAEGFRPLTEEWWHFTLIDEPYPETYFDFVVE